MNLPAAYARRLGLLGLVPFVLLTLLAIALLGRLTVDPSLGAILPDRDPLIVATEEAASHLYSPDYVQILVETEDPFGEEAFALVAEVTEQARKAAPEALVVSATTVQDIRVVDDELQTVPIGPNGGYPSALAETPLFRTLLLTRDASAHVVYVFPDAGFDAMSLGEAIQRITATDPRVSAFGWSPSVVIIEESILRDLRVLGIVSLALVFLIEVVVVRRLAVAAALWLVSGASALWSLATFSLLGRPLSAYTTMVPVTVLALATSYGIHVYRYRSTHPELTFGEAVARVTPIVLTAAATTIVGFSSLLVTQNERLRDLGLLIGIGVTLAMVASLFCLPILFAKLDIRPDGGSGRGSPETPLRFDRAYARLLGAGASRPVVSLAALAAVIVVAALGATMVEPHPTPRDAFVASSIPGRYFDEYHRLTGADEQLEVYLDTGVEFGLVDMATYQSVADAAAAIADDPYVQQVLAVPMFVSWMNGRLAGLTTPLPPANEMELGESLELLRSQDTGLGIDALVDPAYRRTKLLLLVDVRGEHGAPTAARRDTILAGIDEIVRRELPAAAHLVTGGLALTKRSEAYLQDSQLRSALVFFAFLIVLLSALFRDLRWVMVALTPTLVGILVYYGLLGWLGLPSSFLTVFFVAGLMGVSNDDVLYLTLSLRASGARTRAEVRDGLVRSAGAIVQTTLIIVAGIATFAFSSYRLLGHGGIVFCVALVACTGTTLFVVPALISRLITAGAETAGRGERIATDQRG